MVTVLATGGALCAGLVAIGTPAAAFGAASSGASVPPVVTADAVYHHFQAVQWYPAGGVTAAVARAGTNAQSVVTQAARRVLEHEVVLAVRRVAAEHAVAARRAARRKAAALRAAARARAAIAREIARRGAARKTVQFQAAPQRAVPPAGTPREIAEQMLAGDGWTGQFSCLDALWEHESGWNLGAENPSSGAYGIPQALPGSQMASAGADWQTDAATQISWGLTYIQGRYGSPCGAWEHEEEVGWY
jgi:hypothetical protein